MVLAISVFLQLMYYFQTEKKKEKCCSKTFPSVIHSEMVGFM